jgi:hypothetical protein
MGGLGDQDDDNEIVEQFQRADDAIPGLLAVGGATVGGAAGPSTGAMP